MLVTAGIVSSIDWGACGFHPPYTATNGREAWSLMQLHAIDVVMTDIKMPEMDGLTLIKTMREHDYAAEVIILSSYTDFEYVSEALELQTCSYLHKPAMLPEDIAAAVVKAAGKIDQSRRKASSEDSFERLYKRSARKWKERMLLDALKGKLVTEEGWNELPFKCGYHGCFVAVIRFRNGENVFRDKFGKDETLFSYAIANVAEEVMRSDWDYEAVCLAPDLLCLLFSEGQDDVAAQGKRRERFMLLSRVLRTYLELETEMAMRAVPVSVPRISETVSCLLTILDCRDGRLPADQLLVVTDAGHPEWSYRSVWREWLEIQGGGESFPDSDRIEGMYRHLAFNNASFATVLETSGLLLGKLLQQASSYPGVFQELYRREPEMYAKLRLMDDEGSLKRYVIHLWREAESLIREAHPYEIERALRFVEHNMGDPKLGLESAAAHVNVSRAHFSRMFKEHTGETFHQYVTNARLRRAEHLARTTDLKIYEIAEQVGYPDSRYFSKMYKRLNGKQLSHIRAKADQSRSY